MLLTSHQLFVLHTVLYTFAVVKALGPGGNLSAQGKGTVVRGHSAVSSVSRVTSIFFLSLFFCGGGTFIFLSLRGLIDPHSLLLSDPHFCCLHANVPPHTAFYFQSTQPSRPSPVLVWVVLGADPNEKNLGM